jgi:hypothetical protein
MPREHRDDKAYARLPESEDPGQAVSSRRVDESVEVGTDPSENTAYIARARRLLERRSETFGAARVSPEASRVAAARFAPRLCSVVIMVAW